MLSLRRNVIGLGYVLIAHARANGIEMSRPASQGQYRAETDTWLAGSAPSSC